MSKYVTVYGIIRQNPNADKAEHGYKPEKIAPGHVLDLDAAEAKDLGDAVRKFDKDTDSNLPSFESNAVKPSKEAKASTKASEEAEKAAKPADGGKAPAANTTGAAGTSTTGTGKAAGGDRPIE